MRKEDPLLVNPEWLDSHLLVCDLIYNPGQTPLLRLAKERGAKILNGVGMLLYQGAISFELWTGKKAPLEVMRKALIQELNNNWW
jgi:shikimate dehydrogenase